MPLHEHKLNHTILGLGDSDLVLMIQKPHDHELPPSENGYHEHFNLKHPDIFEDKMYWLGEDGAYYTQLANGTICRAWTAEDFANYEANKPEEQVCADCGRTSWDGFYEVTRWEDGEFRTVEICQECKAESC